MTVQSKSMTFYIDFLKQIFANGKPLAKILNTPEGLFLYDTGTNKMMSCRDEVGLLIQGLLEKDTTLAVEDFLSGYSEDEFLAAAEEISAAVAAERILLGKKPQFGLSDHFKDFKAILNSSINGIHLEVTEECPNRCLYCVYQDHYAEKRNFSRKEMSLEVAKRAIDFIKLHSMKSDPVMLGFYGGEPCLRHSFIKDIVAYAREIITGKKIIFNMTTNAVLITPEIAGFLLDEDFSILVSLDGPRDIHDRYRIDKNGNGTFDKTLAGLRLLAEKHREIKKGMITVNVVYTPPFSEEKINRINDFITELEWLPGVNVFINYPSRHSVPWQMVEETGLKEDKSITQWAIERYMSEFENSCPMVKGQVEKRFATFIQRPVLTEPGNVYNLNGCCLPGQRKCFVDTQGSIRICEKMSSAAPVIGDVFNGFDFDAIESIYIKGFSEKSMGLCSGCWGIRLCDVCYIHGFNEKGELDMERKNRYCKSFLNRLEESLGNFVTILAENPEKLEYLYKYEIT